MTFWGFFFLFLIFVPLFMIWGVTMVDIFSRRDISGLWKAIDLLVIFLFPFIGTLVYLIVRPRDVPGAWSAQPSVEPTAAPPPSAASITPANVVSMTDELERLSRLRSSGAISEEEYNKAKSKLLAA